MTNIRQIAEQKIIRTLDKILTAAKISTILFRDEVDFLHGQPIAFRMRESLLGTTTGNPELNYITFPGMFA